MADRTGTQGGPAAGGLEYRLPTEAEWEYACRGGSKASHYFWWGNELEEGEGRLNISAIDFLPGRNKTWPLAKVPWSDGFAFVSPVDHYGEKGRNGFGLADMCGGVWEFVIDHFDPQGGHEESTMKMSRSEPCLTRCAVAEITSMCPAMPAVRSVWESAA